MRTILKIIYIALCLVFAVIIGLGSYTSFASENYSNLLLNAVKTADETKDDKDNAYDNIVRCFSIFATPLAGKPSLVYSEEDGKNISIIYESVNQHVASYTVDKGKIDVDHVENVYLFVILHPNFANKNSSDKTNPSCIRFYGDNVVDGKEQTYDYLFNQSADVNAASYIASPKSEKEAVLNGSRSLLETYMATYDLIFFPVTETTAGFIKENVGNIKGFNIIDNSGSNAVYKNSEYVDFKFEYPMTDESFYSDMADFVKNYNLYNDAKNNRSNASQNEIDAATEYVSNFTSDPSIFIPKFNEKYIQGYANSDVYTGSDMVMKAIGLCALFMVAATLVFVLLFHLKSIKKFVRRFSKKAEPERKIPNRRPQTNVVISKSKVSTKTEEVLDSSMFEEEKSEEVKEETKVEEEKSEEVNEESLTALEEKETETKEE